MGKLDRVRKAPKVRGATRCARCGVAFEMALLAPLGWPRGDESAAKCSHFAILGTSK